MTTLEVNHVNMLISRKNSNMSNATANSTSSLIDDKDNNDPVNYHRACQRILNLEDTLETQKNAHLEQLKALHDEVKRLQVLVNDLNVKLIVKGSSPDEADTYNQEIIPRAPPGSSLRRRSSIVTPGTGMGTSLLGRTRRPSVSSLSSETGSTTLHGGSTTKLHGSTTKLHDSTTLHGASTTHHVSLVQSAPQENNVTKTPTVADLSVTKEGNDESKHDSEGKAQGNLSLLLLEQKTKYIGLLEKCTIENKRQVKKIDALKAENAIFKQVLATGYGVKFDKKDVKEAVLTYQAASGNHHRLIEKQKIILPPTEIPRNVIGEKIADKALPVLPPIPDKTEAAKQPQPPMQALDKRRPYRLVHKTTKETDATIESAKILMDNTGADGEHEYGNEEEDGIMQKIAQELLDSPSRKKENDTNFEVERPESPLVPYPLPYVQPNWNASQKQWNKKLEGSNIIRRKKCKDLVERSV